MGPRLVTPNTPLSGERSLPFLREEKVGQKKAQQALRRANLARDAVLRAKRGGPRECPTVPSRWFRHRRHRFGRRLIRNRAVASSRARCSPTHVISSSDFPAKSGSPGMGNADIGRTGVLEPSIFHPLPPVSHHCPGSVMPSSARFRPPVMHRFPPFFGRVQSKVEPKKDPLRRPRAAQTWPASRSGEQARRPTLPARPFRLDGSATGVTAVIGDAVDALTAFHAVHSTLCHDVFIHCVCGTVRHEFAWNRNET